MIYWYQQIKRHTGNGNPVKNAVNKMIKNSKIKNSINDNSLLYEILNGLYDSFNESPFDLHYTFCCIIGKMYDNICFISNNFGEYLTTTNNPVYYTLDCLIRDELYKYNGETVPLYTTVAEFIPQTEIIFEINEMCTKMDENGKITLYLPITVNFE